MSSGSDESRQPRGLAGVFGRTLAPSRGDGPWRADAFAVIVGIDTYADPTIPDLRFARKDAQAVYDVLTDPAAGRFHPDNVIMLLDADATERRIRSALGTRLPRRTTPTSTVCIYYAGHGAPVVDVDTRQRSADSIEKYLVPHDAEADDLRATAISMDAIQQYFSWLDAQQVVCFLDTCYSGAAGGRSFERDVFHPRAIFSDEHLDRLAGEGRVVMTACATNEVSLESPEKGHGLFTYYVVRGLRGEADANQDGRITVDELYDYVYHHVYRDARLMDGRMSPVRKGTVRGRVYLAEYVKSGGPPPSPEPPAPQPRDHGLLPPVFHQTQRSTIAAVSVTAAALAASAVIALWNAWPSPPDPVRTRTTDILLPVTAASTGEIAVEWSGAHDARWYVVDAQRTLLAEGFVPAQGKSRVTVPPGDVFVAFRDLPEVRPLPVKVVSGQTSAVAPLVGQLEITWTGANSINAALEDQTGKPVRTNWHVPAKASAIVDLAPGRYTVVAPNVERQSVTVVPKAVSRLNLRPEPSSTPVVSIPEDRPGPKDVDAPEPIVRARLPYTPGYLKLPSGDDLGLVLIEGGRFLMGSDPKRHRTALQDEQPQSLVDIPAFYMARYEVTVDQYKACVDDGRCKHASPLAVAGDPDLPVRFISWDEAVQYCDWLDVKLRSWTGTPAPLAVVLRQGRGGPSWKVRLPSEAEWEKAARGTTNRIYPWGDIIDASRGNFGNQLKQPTTVGRYPTGASPFGLLDMSGNVWEWTRSRVLRYPYQPNDDREDTRPSKATTRVIRGGSFQTEDPWAARRNRSEQSDRVDFIGFRIAVGPPQ